MNSQICTGLGQSGEQSSDLFIQIVNDEYKVFKFLPSNTGSKAVLSAVTDMYNFSLITDVFDTSENIFHNFGIEVEEKGEFIEIPEDDLCNGTKINLYACLPTEPILPSANLDIKDLTVFHKLVQYHMTLENCKNKITQNHSEADNESTNEV